MRISEKIKSKQDKEGMLRRSLERIIQLYTDKSHFVYELLQNAEDSGATSISFNQYDDRLEVMHNGAAFTESNLQGLCDIGKSDKWNDLNKIGEFGVGFKSVFGICEKVRLYSRPRKNDVVNGCVKFAVEINDFTTPSDIEFVKIPDGYTTMFVFPYAVGFDFSGFTNIKKLKAAISKRLKNLGVTTLLFMTHLKSIDYYINVDGKKSSGTYILEKTSFDGSYEYVNAIESNDNKEVNKYAYYKFTKKLGKRFSNRSIDVAFAVDKDKNGREVFVKSKNPYISVYFPTETESKLDFIVQGPFRTTPNRSSVPSDDEENIYLAQEMSKLVKKSILELRNRHILDLDLINILPMDEEEFYNYDLFEPVYYAVYDLFDNEKILPTHDGKYAIASHSLLARGQNLIDLFSDNDISQLINDRKKYCWLSEQITELGKYKNVHEYLRIEHNVKVIRPEDLGTYIRINPYFLPLKDNTWVIGLYDIFAKTAQILQEKDNRNILDVNFVKTINGDFVAPYKKYENEDGYEYEPNVFIFSNQHNKVEVNYVDLELVKERRDFFTKVLRLKEPDSYQMLKERLAKEYACGKHPSIKKNVKDIQEIVSYFDINDSKMDLIQCLEHNFSIKCCHNGKTEWVNPYTTHVCVAESETGLNLKEYYKNIDNNDIYYIDAQTYFDNLISYDDLIKLNVYDDIFIYEEKEEYLGYIQKFYYIDMLDDALDCISRYPNEPDSIIKSKTIFQSILDNEEIIKNRIDGSFERTNIIDKLTDVSDDPYSFTTWDGKWLYTNDNEWVSQLSITKEELNSNVYGPIKEGSNIYEVLKFKQGFDDLLIANQEEFQALSIEQKKCFLELGLNEMFGITTEELKTSISKGFISKKISNNEFDFPSQRVNNWDSLRKHVAQILVYANPVKFDYVVKHIRVSKNAEDVRAYLMNMYRVNNKNKKYVCQLCHKPKNNLEQCQLEINPDVELEPLHVLLCPSCARKFRNYRNNKNIYNEFMKRITSLKETEIENNSPVKIIISDEVVWFTQAHIAEIKELLILKDTIKDKKKVKKIKESQKKRNDSKNNDTHPYSNLINTEIYHKGTKSKGVVKSIDTEDGEDIITIRFISGKERGKTRNYSLKMLIEKNWLTYD